MSILAISGYAGSGKNTVGSIIQYLDCKERFKFDYPFEKFIAFNESTWKQKAFAGKLKQIASILTGIPVEKFEDQEFKKSYLGKEWNKKFLYPFSGPDHTTVEEQMTVREFLQKLGTEAIRDNIHTNAWVNALFADYHPPVSTETFRYAKGYSDEREKKMFIPIDQAIEYAELYPKWIITDCRFRNEAQAVKDRGGIVARVIRGEQYYGERKEILSGRENLTLLLDDSWYVRYRNNDNNELIHVFIGDRMGDSLDTVIFENPSSMHISETGLDHWKFDQYILNTKDIDFLQGEVKRTLSNVLSEQSLV